MQKQLIEETLARKINEELGIVDNITSLSRRIISDVLKNFTSLKNSTIYNSFGIRQTVYRINVRFSEQFQVMTNVVLWFFGSKFEFDNFISKNPNFVSGFNPKQMLVTANLFIVGNNRDVEEWQKTVQHELHHAFQEFSKKKNGVETKKNTTLYSVSKYYVNDDDVDLASIARAIYLWGTNETSVYGNEIYVAMIAAFEKYGYSIDIVHRVLYIQRLYVFRKYINFLLDKLETGKPVNIGLISSTFGIDRKKLKSICKMCLEKIDHVITKTTAKAKLDFDRETSKYDTGIGEITDKL